MESESKRNTGYYKLSLCLLWMISIADGHGMETCWCFARLITALDAFTIKIRKDRQEMTSMISQATMHGSCCPNDVYESTGTISPAQEVAYTGVLDIGCSVAAFAMRKRCSCSLGFTANTLPSATLLVFVVVQLSTGASSTISIGTGSDLYRTIFPFNLKASLYILVDEVCSN